MNNENQEFREYFEVFSPDTAQSERMYTALTALTPAKRSRAKLRTMPLAALLTALFLSVTAVATAPLTAPLIKRYFFPDTGIVEVTSDSITPLYLIMDLTPDEDESGKIVRRFGYWHDGMAYVWFESETAYTGIQFTPDIGAYFIGKPDFVLPNGAVLECTGGRAIGNNETIGQFLLTYPIDTVEAAEAGITFDDCLFRFNRMPAEYSTYSVEHEEVRLTLIPLTDDKTTFAYELDFTDERKGELSVSLPGLFSDCESTSFLNIFLVDESGRKYRLESHGQLLSVPETPQAEITGFLCERLSFFCRFDKEIRVNLPIPEKGTTVGANIELPFPDGVYTGIISSVQFHSNEEKQQAVPIHGPEYEGEYITLKTLPVFDGETLIYFMPGTTSEYNDFVHDNRDKYPYETKIADGITVQSRTSMGSTSYYRIDNFGTSTIRYIPNGESTIPMILSGYNAEITADWSISFTE